MFALQIFILFYLFIYLFYENKAFLHSRYLLGNSYDLIMIPGTARKTMIHLERSIYPHVQMPLLLVYVCFAHNVSEIHIIFCQV